MFSRSRREESRLSLSRFRGTFLAQGDLEANHLGLENRRRRKKSVLTRAYNRSFYRSFNLRPTRRRKFESDRPSVSAPTSPWWRSISLRETRNQILLGLTSECKISMAEGILAFSTSFVRFSPRIPSPSPPPFSTRFNPMERNRREPRSRPGMPGSPESRNFLGTTVASLRLQQECTRGSAIVRRGTFTVGINGNGGGGGGGATGGGTNGCRAET